MSESVGLQRVELIGAAARRAVPEMHVLSVTPFIATVPVSGVRRDVVSMEWDSGQVAKIVVLIPGSDLTQ